MAISIPRSAFLVGRHRHEAGRIKLVRLIFITYWLLVFEGALRKWAFPSIHQFLFFIRDPFVFFIYLAALKYHFFSINKFLIAAFIIFSITLVVGSIQVVATELPVLVYAYGMRNYFFYIPLAFIIGRCVNSAELIYFFRLNLKIAIPMAVLVVVQFSSSPDSFINKGINSDGFVFRVTEDLVRTTGTFSFTLGQTYYAASIFAMLVYFWLLPANKRGCNALWLCAASAATAVLIFLSGSRTVFFLVTIILCFTWISGVLIRKRTVKAKALFVPIILSVIIIFSFPILFSTAFEAMLYRQQDAVAAEGSTLLRALRSFTDFLSVFIDVPFLGYGLGYGTNGGGQYATGSVGFTLAEDEWTRIIMELGPIFGALFILFRISFFLSLLKNAIISAKIYQDPLSLILFGFIGIVLLNGGITMQGTVNGYGWIFSGFCMAALTNAKRNMM